MGEVLSADDLKGPQEVRTRRVSPMMKFKLCNIAAHLGITENALMKRELSDIIAKYPEHMHKPLPKDV